MIKQIQECANNKGIIQRDSGYFSMNKYYNKHTKNDRTEDLRMLDFIKKKQILIPLEDRNHYSKDS